MDGMTSIEMLHCHASWVAVDMYEWKPANLPDDVNIQRESDNTEYMYSILSATHMKELFKCNGGSEPMFSFPIYLYGNGGSQPPMVVEWRI